jgi:hypothetical protein
VWESEGGVGEGGVCGGCHVERCQFSKAYRHWAHESSGGWQHKVAGGVDAASEGKSCFCPVHKLLNSSKT